MVILMWLIFIRVLSSELLERPVVEEHRVHTRPTVFEAVQGDTSGVLDVPVGTTVRLDVTTWPIMLIFPEIDGVQAVVYSQAGDQQYVLTTPTNVFALYFKNKDSLGYIDFTTTGSRTRVTYYAAKHDSSWRCKEFFVSSAPSIRWTAGNDRQGNFTLQEDQDVCFFHISSQVTNIEVAYNLQAGFSRLYYHYSESDSFYTGTGPASGVIAQSTRFTAFRWYTIPEATLEAKTNFLVVLESDDSSLPFRTAHGFDDHSALIVLREGISKATRSVSKSPSGTRTRSPYPTATKTPSPTLQRIMASDDASGAVTLYPGGSVRIDVGSYPLFVVFPTFGSCSAVVRNLSGASGPSTVITQFRGPGNVFAVYFKDEHARGSLEVTSPSHMTLKYFIVKYPAKWNCQRVWVSTSPENRWSAQVGIGNFTIAQGQEYCFVHVSDKPTSVFISLKTQGIYEHLRYQLGTAPAQTVPEQTDALTVGSPTGFTAFQWETDSYAEITTGLRMLVEVTSSGSSLPYRSGSLSRGKTVLIQDGIFGSDQGRGSENVDMVFEMPLGQDN